MFSLVLMLVLKFLLIAFLSLYYCYGACVVNIIVLCLLLVGRLGFEIRMQSSPVSKWIRFWVATGWYQSKVIHSNKLRLEKTTRPVIANIAIIISFLLLLSSLSHY
jgi:hypothetical protein